MAFFGTELETYMNIKMQKLLPITAAAMPGTSLISRSCLPVSLRSPRASFFEFADAELEDLLPVQKQFLGMGPRNVRAVQASLLDIARELGIDASSLPVPAVVR